MSAKIKILHVIPSLGVGGAEKMLHALCARLPRDRFQHKVAALKSGGETEAALRALPVDVDLLKSADGLLPGLLDMPRLYRELKKSISDFSPHIVHTWLTRANVIGRFAARSAGIENIVSGLRVMESEKRYHLWAEALTSAYSKIVTVNCRALENFAAREIGVPRSKIVLIPNGIDLPSPGQVQAAARSGAPPVVGMMGRLHAQKAFDVFLRAAREVLRKHPETVFAIAGEGPERQNLEALARELGIAEKVRFLGLVRNALDFYPGIDIFALTSRWEGMPNVLLEAMSLEKPVVATNVGGAPDLIEDGREGFLVAPENPGAAAEKLCLLLESETLRRTLAKAAREKVTNLFTLDKMTAAYGELYESLAR